MMEILEYVFIVLFLIVSYMWLSTSKKLREKELSLVTAEQENNRVKVENDTLELKNIELTKEKERITLSNMELSSSLYSAKSSIELKNELIDTLKGDMSENYNRHEREILNLKSDFEERMKKREAEYNETLATLKNESEKLRNEHKEALLQQNKLLFNENGKELMKEIFDPIKERMEEYQKNINGYQERLDKNENSAKTSMEHLFKYTTEIGKQVDNFANILRGDKKTLGDFGEIQLKSVLQGSGLVEGSQYTMQANFKDENRNYRPDAVVFLDNERTIVIDSKFSLPSNLDFEKIDERVCAELAGNIRARVDELASKPYGQFDDNTYEYILMFIPYSNILDLALSYDSNLYQYAYKKNIYIATPYTLFMALKTISITWTAIQREENTKNMYVEIGKMLEKLQGVVQAFNEVQSRVKQLNEATALVSTRLTDGRGNLMSKLATISDKYGVTIKRDNSIKFNNENDDEAEIIDNTALISAEKKETEQSEVNQQKIVREIEG